MDNEGERMIVEYLRPKNIKEALDLIDKSKVKAYPIGGGTSIRVKAKKEDISVLDLQGLMLDQIITDNDWIKIGATTTLSSIEQHPDIPVAIREAVCLEGTSNTRNQATLGGRLVAFDGRSALITTLIATDAITEWDNESKEIPLGEWLALPDKKPGKLLVSVKIKRNINLVFEVINRTKLDLPLFCVAVARWKSGRVRVALGGFGNCPKMVFDGQDDSGAIVAVESACQDANDHYASSKYRISMAGILVRRSLERLQD
jgi:probable selenate reductase FAD-binding subunit